MSTKKQMFNSVVANGGIVIQEQKPFYMIAEFKSPADGNKVYSELGDILEKRPCMFIKTHCIASMQHDGRCFIYIYRNKVDNSFAIFLSCSEMSFMEFVDSFLEAGGVPPMDRVVH